VLAPHHAEDPEFGERGLAVPQKLFNLFVFAGSEAVLPDDLGRKGRIMEVVMGKFYCSKLLVVRR
jgi:hypothetical protein